MKIIFGGVYKRKNDQHLSVSMEKMILNTKSEVM